MDMNLKIQLLLIASIIFGLTGNKDNHKSLDEIEFQAEPTSEYGDAGQFNNHPGTVTVHENYDDTYPVWNNIDATCYVRSTCSSYRCTYYLSYSYSFFGGIDINSRCRSVKYYYTCYHNVACNRCRVSSNTAMFYESGLSIYKAACTSPGCGPRCNADFCLNEGQTETIGVECWRTGYETNGLISETFTMTASDNSPPSIWLEEGNDVTINKDSYGVGDYVNRIRYSDSDLSIGGDSITYSLTDDTKFIPWDYPDVSRSNDRLFTFDAGNGYLYVAQDLSMEYSYVYTGIQFCIADRRDSGICTTLTITLWACYQIPTCIDQQVYDFWDTHPVGGTLFQMSAYDPIYHFPDFNPTWARLTWTIDDNSYLDVAHLDSNSGILSTTGNITVWPSWRYREYQMTVRVSNSESCGRTTTCQLDYWIWFTNYQIRFENLPNSIIVNEDLDDYFEAIQLYTFDYNPPTQDNVTCSMSFVPYEPNLFEWRDDGRKASDSYSIHRLACQNRECGFHCEKGFGCFTHNTTDQYEFVFTIYCEDAYDTHVTDYFTIRLDYNRAPTFTNLPQTITLNSLHIGEDSLLYSIQYSDFENEVLHYNFTFAPNNGEYNGILIFQCDTVGNYYNSLANISSTTYYHNMPPSTYYIYICGTERRNMICETLTIIIQNTCPGNPVCTGASTTIPDSTVIGYSLFSIVGQAGAGSTGTLTYSFTSPAQSYFNIDRYSGEITVAKTLTAVSPSSVYHLVGYVTDSSACNYGSCQFEVTVLFTNHPISIIGLPYIYTDLPEDTEAVVPLVDIQTQDDNTDDTVDCNLDEITSPQTESAIPQDIFRIRETYTGSMSFLIESREFPGFSSAITEYDITFTVVDKYGSSAQGSLTVTIKPNETPAFTNLNGATAIMVDHFSQKSGAFIYFVSTSDLENDQLTFTSQVDNPFVPLAMNSGGAVYLSRDVSIVDEDYASYSIGICIEDSSHPLQGQVCGHLDVTFNSSQKYPSLSNLPATVSFPEDTTGGTELFNADVSDDNADDIHIFSVTVKPLDAATMFALDANTGVLKLQPGALFNYEERQEYLLTFTVKDQFLTSLQSKELTIQVTNVNEEPVITTSRDIIQFNEDEVPGKLLSQSVGRCSDVDLPDTLTFSIDNTIRSSFFGIDSTTADLYLAQEWDLENIAMPTTAVLHISCTDIGGFSSTDFIYIEISPINEHDPVLDKTHLDIEIDSTTSVVDDLAWITASDTDFGDDDTFIYDIVGLGEGDTYFLMTDTGRLRIRSPIQLYYDRIFEFTISDGDATPQARTAYCSVTVNYTAPAEEMPVKPTYCTTCTTEGKLIVAALVCEGIALLVIIAAVIHHILRIGAKTAAATTNAANVLRVNSIQRANNTQNWNNRDNDTRYSDDDESFSDDDDDELDSRLARNTLNTSLTRNPTFNARQPLDHSLFETSFSNREPVPYHLYAS